MIINLEPTLRQRAESLLRIHGGACFVPAGNELVGPFCDMESERLVTVTYGMGTISGITVRRKGFRVKPLEAALVDTPAH